MTTPTPPQPLTADDAMIVAVVATECFNSLQGDDLDGALLRGALLLYDAMVRRIGPSLPTDLNVDTLASFARVMALAAQVRQLEELPPVL
jgi:hypothetical protein